MKEHILIVEDQFVEADYLRLLLEKAGYIITGIARSVPQAQKMIKEQRPDFVLLDIFLKGKQTGIDLAKMLAADNIPFVYLSANSNEEILTCAKQTQPYGFLVKPFREKDLLVALEIARYRHAHSTEARYHKEMELRKVLRAIPDDTGAWSQKMLTIATALQSYMPFDFITMQFDHLQMLGFLRIGFNEYQIIGMEELAVISGKKIDELMTLQLQHPVTETAVIYDDTAFQHICKQPCLKKLFAATFRLKTHLEMPMQMIDRKPFSLGLYSRRADVYATEHIELLERMQFALMQAIEKISVADKSQGDIYAADNVNILEGFEGIVGKVTCCCQSLIIFRRWRLLIRLF